MTARLPLVLGSDGRPQQLQPGDVLDPVVAWGLPAHSPGFGSRGQDGTSFYSGKGPPAATLGKHGDHYLDLVSGDVWRKHDSQPLFPPVWVQAGNLTGPPGPAGEDGAPGPRGLTGSGGSGGLRFNPIPLTVVFTATAGPAAYTSVALASLVPVNALLVTGVVGVTTTSQTPGIVSIASDSLGTGAVMWGGNAAGTPVALNGFVACSTFTVALSAPQVIWWRANVTTAFFQLSVSGYWY
jgi:hypothetical protein